MCSASRSGFTIMELLIVIVVIGVLTSILLPAVALVRDTAYSTRCLGNHRQLGTAYLAYAVDHRGMIPPVQMDLAGGSSYGYWGFWCGYIKDFVGNGQHAAGSANMDWMMLPVFRCPAHRMTALCTNPLDPRTPARSYGANGAFDTTNAMALAYGYKLARIDGPSQTINLADRCGDYDPYFLVGGVFPPYKAAAVAPGTWQPVGMDGIEYLFCISGKSIRAAHRGRFALSTFDGHAELAIPADTIAIPCPTTGAGAPNRWIGTY